VPSTKLTLCKALESKDVRDISYYNRKADFSPTPVKREALVTWANIYCKQKNDRISFFYPAESLAPTPTQVKICLEHNLKMFYLFLIRNLLRKTTYDITEKNGLENPLPFRAALKRKI